ncbi:hypothetical protein OH413_24315, partial [Salmonella enterica]|nr:hypothetical protein [Salmonella enterica]
ARAYVETQCVVLAQRIKFVEICHAERVAGRGCPDSGMEAERPGLQGWLDYTEPPAPAGQVQQSNSGTEDRGTGHSEGVGDAVV